MNTGKRYLLDANIFIQAARQYYGFDLCPGFWKALVRGHEDNSLFSIEHVKAELAKGSDRLKTWAIDEAPSSMFKKVEDIRVTQAYGKMQSWVQAHTQFTSTAKAEFASVADAWVIAYAKANNFIVVTHEEYAPDAKRKVPIPNVCVEFDVEYTNTFEMLRALEFQFDLRRRKVESS